MKKSIKIFGMGTVVMLLFLVFTSVSPVQANTANVNNPDGDSEPTIMHALEIVMIGVHVLDMGPGLYTITHGIQERNRMIEDLIINGC